MSSFFNILFLLDFLKPHTWPKIFCKIAQEPTKLKRRGKNSENMYVEFNSLCLRCIFYNLTISLKSGIDWDQKLNLEWHQWKQKSFVVVLKTKFVRDYLKCNSIRAYRCTVSKLRIILIDHSVSIACNIIFKSPYVRGSQPRFGKIRLILGTEDVLSRLHKRYKSLH